MRYLEKGNGKRKGISGVSSELLPVRINCYIQLLGSVDRFPNIQSNGSADYLPY